MLERLWLPSAATVCKEDCRGREELADNILVGGGLCLDAVSL